MIDALYLAAFADGLAMPWLYFLENSLRLLDALCCARACVMNTYRFIEGVHFRRHSVFHARGGLFISCDRHRLLNRHLPHDYFAILLKYDDTFQCLAEWHYIIRLITGRLLFVFRHQASLIWLMPVRAALQG